MKKIAILRSNPKDAAFGKVISALSGEYLVECFIWDRQRDYQPVVVNVNVHYTGCGIRARYYSLSTLLKMFLFELWLFVKLLFSDADCVHAIDLDTGFAGLCAARLRGRPFVYQCLDPFYAALPKNWPKFLAAVTKRIENYVVSHCDLFIITDLLRMPQHEGASPERVIELANVPYLDLSKFRLERSEGFLAGYIGSLTEGRNLLTMIETVGEMEAEGVRLIVGGFGPLENEVRESAARYRNVTFLPWMPYEKLLEMESTFDLFIQVLDKDSEHVKWGSASPNKLFESMAFGKPIIIGAGTLTERKVRLFGNGVAVPYDSKEELRKAVLMFKKDPALAREMGEKGKAEFEHNWRPEIMAKRLTDAYRDIMR